MSVRIFGINICPKTTDLPEFHSDVQEVDTCLQVIEGELDAWMERVQRLEETRKFYLSVLPYDEPVINVSPKFYGLPYNFFQ